jgi:hypothetical protein
VKGGGQAFKNKNGGMAAAQLPQSQRPPQSKDKDEIMMGLGRTRDCGRKMMGEGSWHHGT